MNRDFMRHLVVVVASITAITAIAIGAATRYVAPPLALTRTTVTGPPSVRLGARLYERKGCVQCHSNDGTARIGPTFLHDFGTTITLDNGATVAMDEDYIRESLFSPRAKARPGYPPSMPSFEGMVTERELTALTAYLESLR